jgi:hypothetical protein
MNKILRRSECMRKCFIGGIMIALSAVLAVTTIYDLCHAKMYDGLVVGKEIVSGGTMYLVRVKDDNDVIRVLSISNNMSTFKFGSSSIYNDITEGQFYRFYTTGSDANIRFY